MMHDQKWLEPSFEHRPEIGLPEGWSYIALGNLGLGQRGDPFQGARGLLGWRLGSMGIAEGYED
jgi:hypothetical protein